MASVPDLTDCPRCGWRRDELLMTKSSGDLPRRYSPPHFVERVHQVEVDEPFDLPSRVP